MSSNSNSNNECIEAARSGDKARLRSVVEQMESEFRQNQEQLRQNQEQEGTKHRLNLNKQLNSCLYEASKESVRTWSSFLCQKTLASTS